MRLIWTRSKLPLSLLIRSVTGEDCSHFAIVFDSPAGGLMFESNLLGTHPKFYRTALKEFEVIHQLVIDIKLEDEDKIWDKVVNEFDNKPYDFLGALYLGWRVLLRRFLKIPMPIKNKWSNRDCDYCDEIFNALDGVSGLPDIRVKGGMITPHDLYSILTSTPGP